MAKAQPLTISPAYSIGQIVEYQEHNRSNRFDRIVAIDGNALWSEKSGTQTWVTYKMTLGTLVRESEIVRLVENVPQRNTSEDKGQ